MPLVFRENVPGGVLLIWKVAESEAELSRLVTPEDMAALEGLKPSRRRLESLAWRAAVRAERPDATLSYNDIGAPVIGGRGIPDERGSDDLRGDGRRGESSAGSRAYGCISVAHTEDCVAVLLSENTCGVDIEESGRDFSRALARFVSPQEAALADDLRLPAAIWCAKEALYKASGRRGLDLLRDINITSADIAAGVVRGRVADGPERDVRLIRYEGYMVAYLVF